MHPALCHRIGRHVVAVRSSTPYETTPSLASGVVSATEAVQYFYHAENCLYARKQLRNREANAIMSRGVQLPDLFESLSTEEAQREFYHELEIMRSLCLKLLEKGRSPDVAERATA